MKTELEPGLGGMRSINHRAFAGLCIKTRTKQQAKNLKHDIQKNKQLCTVVVNTMIKHIIHRSGFHDEVPSVLRDIVKMHCKFKDILTSLTQTQIL